MASIATRLLIPLYPFRVATLDELCVLVADVEEVAVFCFVEGLRVDAAAGEALPRFGVVEELRVNAAAGEELPPLGLLKSLGMQLIFPSDSTVQELPAEHQLC